LNYKKSLEKIRNFLSSQREIQDKLKIYKRKKDPLNYFSEINIGVKNEEFKEIILQEETELELGGINKESFSLIYPLEDLNLINNDKITLIGPEVNEIVDKAIDFGIFMLIGVKNLSETIFNEFKNFNFISNGIEGFMIRTIPRRFWCRVSQAVIKKFSFELLANAIMFLYMQKFQEKIKSMELIIINSKPELIKSFINLTSSIRTELDQKWKEKVNEWKRRIDCNFDWNCNECPYYEICEDIKDVLEQREVLEE
jgi:CO dehydrogenase/acetyl-CoA synthase beta subunit